MGFAAGGAEGPATRPAPGMIEQIRARKIVRETFQKEYGAAGRGERAGLARTLYRQAMQTEDDAAARYVLLGEARDLAAGVGDGALAGQAVGALARDYGGDELKMLVAALKAAVEVERHEGEDPDNLVSGTVRAAWGGMDRAIARDEYVAAAQLAGLASDAAGKSRNASMQRIVQERRREVEGLREEFDRMRAARKVLAQWPEDPEANLVAGRFLCFIKEDFGEGLSLLAKGSDATLKGLARREMASPGDAQEKLGIANLWWELAQGQNGVARRNLERHAGSHYRRMVAGLSGLNRLLAEKRLEAVEAEAMRRRNLNPGLFTELFRGTDLTQRVKARIDSQIDFDWGEHAPDEALPKDDFSYRWTGAIRIAAEGQYQLIVIANTGVRLWIDDKLVLENQNLSRNRNGVRIPVRLAAGLHAMKLEYWDTSGIARMRLLWRRPASGRDEVIPASVFYYEGMPGVADLNEPSAGPAGK